MLAGKKCAAQIDLDGLLPFGLAKGNRVSHDRTADIVVQNVDASAACDGRLNRARNLGGRRGIRNDRFALTTLFENRRRGFLQRVGVDVDSDHMRAFARKEYS